MSSTKGILLDVDESRSLIGFSVSPFVSGMRVHCPLKSFAPRKTYHCVDCQHFKGVLTTEITMAEDEKETDISYLTKKFRIYCDHPLSRRIMYVPED